MGARGGVRAGKAYVEIALRDRVQAGLKRVSKRLQSFGKTTAVMGSAMMGAAGAVLGPLAAMVKQFSDAGDAVEKMAARTGMSAEAVSELAHAAGLSGTDTAALENGVRKMQQTIGDAAGGMGSAQEALAALGLSAQNLQSMSPDQQLAAIADRMAAIQDPALRTAAAMDVFGRSGTQLIPMMADGAAGIQAMRDQARDLGLSMSGETAASAAALNDALGTMWSTIKGLTLNIGAALAPAVTELANRASAMIGKVVKFVQANKPLIVTIAAVAAGIGLAGVALVTIGGLAAAAGLALSGLAAIIGGIGTVVGLVLSPIGLLAAGVLALGAAWVAWTASGRAAGGELITTFRDLLKIGKDTIGGLITALTAGDLQLAGKIVVAGLNLAWATIADAASRIFGETFNGILGHVGATIRAVMKAVSEGNWQQAGEVIMTTLEAAWLAGVAKLTEIWQGLKVAMIEAFAGVVIAVHKMWSGMVEGLANKLLDLAAQDGPAGAVARKLIGVDMRAEDARGKKLETERRDVVKRNLEGTIVQWQGELAGATAAGDTAKVEQLTAAIAQAQQELAGLSGPLNSATEDAKRIVADATRDAQDAVGAYWGGVAGSAQQAARDKVVKAEQAAAAARAKLDELAGLPAGTGTEGQKTAARAELDAALAEAAKLKGLWDAKTAGDKVGQVGDGLTSLGGSKSAVAGEVQGTFNAMAIRGMGVDSLAQRTAKATENVAKNTDELVKQARTGNLVFA